ncbi:ABC transporter permease [Streptomyces sp. 8K308]|uniref:ABC transporter permease n=1 Tax=Streptomyces sp. 8K308 TaxID=2530388 RepID=UPI001049ADFD|nr:ABC transporter permease [Streptomyces sp. 8K308]TDC20301.1 ABC transporter permease [Streptomyces sp. 8K308]
MSRLNTWRLALRIARRDARRAKGRSALVIAMIALPILVVSAADLTFRTAELSPAETLTRELGLADARYQIATQGSPVRQNPEGDYVEYDENADDMVWEDDPRPDDEVLAQVEGALPPGATVLPDATAYLTASTRTGLANVELREIDARDPLTEGMLTLLRGDFPTEPGEVAATQAFLDESGLRVGSEVTIGDIGEPYRITGAYELPSDLDSEQVIALPGAVLPHLEGDRPARATATFLVDVPDGVVDWPTVLSANEQGLTVISRDVTLNPPPADQVLVSEGFSDSSVDAEAMVVIVTVVSLIILEICLLAGPAFAVGARRARRQLGLVGANGGDRGQLRAIMLASGVVLGAGAAVVGTVGGVLLTLATRPLLEGIGGARFGSWDFRVLEIGAVALLAVVTGLLAAVVPAVNAARTDVLESLTGRRGVRRAGRALPTIGAIALVGGAAIAILGAMTMDDASTVAVGAIIAELGVVALTPLLVGGFGRLARRLPLSGRLALRDAARNRGRTAPAVAAIMAATAGAVAVATVSVSDAARQEAEYEPALPAGGVVISTYSPAERALLDPARQVIETEMPTTDRADVWRVVVNADCDGYVEDCGYVQPSVPEENECPLWVAGSESLDTAERRELAADDRCAGSGGTVMGGGGLTVADPELLDVLGIEDEGAREALERGEVVVFAGRYLDADDRVTIETYATYPEEWDEDGQSLTRPDDSVTLPGHRVTAESYGFELLVSPAAAEAAGLVTVADGSYYATDRMPTGAEQQAVAGALEDLATRGGVVGGLATYVEDGFEADTSMEMLILSLAAGLLALGAAGIATGLAQADSEADLTTLAAVGASPRVRRTLSGLQCGLVAAMGVLLGGLSGLIPAIALRIADHRSNLRGWEEAWDNGWDPGIRPELFIELPWTTFGQLILVVPLVACLVAALLTRSRITLARRAG